jgi:hypothetical protein
MGNLDIAVVDGGHIPQNGILAIVRRRRYNGKGIIIGIRVRKLDGTSRGESTSLPILDALRNVEIIGDWFQGEGRELRQRVKGRVRYVIFLFRYEYRDSGVMV